MDPLHPYIWQSSGTEVFRWQTNGTPVVDGSGWPVLYPSGGFRKGLVVDARGHVWTAHGEGSTTVGHLDTNGVLLGTVTLSVSNVLGRGPTGVAVDAAGKIWASNLDSNGVMRIEPEAGTMVLWTNVVAGVTNVVTNYVGQADLRVDLGDGRGHPAPYNVAAQPYNYSDMTGFNNRIVNPGGQPLKGYWVVVDDSGQTNLVWRKVSWTDNLAQQTNCSVTVLVRASDDRGALLAKPFREVTNNVPFTGLNGRYIEVRVAMTRASATNNLVIYDLTLHGRSSTFPEGYVDYAWPIHEGDDALFLPVVEAPGPFAYLWYVQYPWMEEWDWTFLPAETNATFLMTNVDTWVDGTRVKAQAITATGESVMLEAAELYVGAVGINLPNSGSSGPASRYPATINVFGQPTNFNTVRVEVTVWGLSHTRSADLSVLLVSPLGKQIMLMSNVGGTNGVTGGILRFVQGWSEPTQFDPLQTPGPSPWPRYLGPSNYGQVAQMPQVGSDPPPSHTGIYSVQLYDLELDNPNGHWKLYIYDNVSPGGNGSLTGSWDLDFTFQ
ncbi:MAG TPA: hypothetical protein VI136_13615 [Verrucomicrobiae bacterium]